MDWEEEQVDIHMAAGNSLNMIPGGFKGSVSFTSTTSRRVSMSRSKSAMPPSPNMPKPNMRAAAAGSQEYQTCWMTSST